MGLRDSCLRPTSPLGEGVLGGNHLRYKDVAYTGCTVLQVNFLLNFHFSSFLPPSSLHFLIFSLLFPICHTKIPLFPSYFPCIPPHYPHIPSYPPLFSPQFPPFFPGAALAENLGVENLLKFLWIPPTPSPTCHGAKESGSPGGSGLAAMLTRLRGNAPGKVNPGQDSVIGRNGGFKGLFPKRKCFRLLQEPHLRTFMLKSPDFRCVERC